MPELPAAHSILPTGQWSTAYDRVILSYDDRFLRRKRLVTAQNDGFLVDLAETVSLNHGDALVLEDGRLIEVIAAREPLFEITGTGDSGVGQGSEALATKGLATNGADTRASGTKGASGTNGLHRLAWHIGNRHTPCQIEDHRLLIRRDHVLLDMLQRLGAHIHLVEEPFLPEGGAYGLGRTMGHDHGPSEPAQDHGHGHAHLEDRGHRHEHSHGHAHQHDHGHDNQHSHAHDHSHPPRGGLARVQPMPDGAKTDPAHD